MQRRHLILGVVLVLGAGAALGIRSMWPVINDVTTGETPAYPNLQPQRFGADAASVFAAALASAKAIDLEITASDATKGEIRGVAKTRIMRFKDDVTITVTRAGDRAVVNIRSASRLGQSDFGVNAKRIELLQAEIASRL
ncbi:MAG: DUF1499 domain-containing protein [Thermoanaerobaculia bacterium]